MRPMPWWIWLLVSVTVSLSSVLLLGICRVSAEASRRDEREALELLRSLRGLEQSA